MDTLFTTKRYFAWEKDMKRKNKQRKIVWIGLNLRKNYKLTVKTSLLQWFLVYRLKLQCLFLWSCVQLFSQKSGNGGWITPKVNEKSIKNIIYFALFSRITQNFKKLTLDQIDAISFHKNKYSIEYILYQFNLESNSFAFK